MFIIKHEQGIDRAAANWLPNVARVVSITRGITLKLSVCQDCQPNNRDQLSMRIVSFRGPLAMFDDGSLMKLSNILITNENMCGCRRLHGRMSSSSNDSNSSSSKLPIYRGGFRVLTKGCGQP